MTSDRLVSMDARLDRPNHTLVINGLWLEEGFGADAAYQAAFERGLECFARFLGAELVKKI